MHKKNFRELSTLLSTFQPVIGAFSKHAEAEKKKGVAYKRNKSREGTTMRPGSGLMVPEEEEEEEEKDEAGGGDVWL